MSYTAAALDDVIPFGGRSVSLGSYRRVLLGGVAAAVGTLAVGWVMTTSVKVVTAWTAAALHGTSHTMQAPSPFATPEAMALANPYGTLASAVFGSARAVNVPASEPAANVADAGPAVSFESKWSGLMAQAFAPADHPQALSDRAFGPVASLTSPLSYPLPAANVAATNPPAQSVVRVAGAPDAAQEADLKPPAAAIAAPAGIVPLPPKRIFDTANNAPSSAPDQNARSSAAPRTAEAAPPRTESGPFSFFAKLFAPHSGEDNSASLPGPNSRTAVYDIAAHMVYLPNGERLEAHSGIGGWMDDPNSVNVKNRGATPPHVYNLTLRESLFHGVQAIRLTPVGDGAMYGRDGILAHSFMLGPSGQSNGCVSFRDYPAFLRAYQRGEVDRIVVVPRLGANSHIARASRSHGDRYALQ